MPRDTSLFIARNDKWHTLEEVSKAVFLAIGIEDTEERFSSNYPPDDYYYVAYASNVVIKVCDLDDVKEGCPYHLSLNRPTYRSGNAPGPDSATQVAEVLSKAGIGAFVPIGNWSRNEWDGDGVEYAV